MSNKCQLFIYFSRRRVFILGAPSIRQKQTLRPFSRELLSIVLLDEHESLLGLIFSKSKFIKQKHFLDAITTRYEKKETELGSSSV